MNSEGYWAYPLKVQPAVSERLKDAAPDLAEALLAFRPMMAAGCDCIYSGDPDDTKRCPCKMMHAALAKAGL